jgi:diguanylate cyclase (GGDEF)-like protein
MVRARRHIARAPNLVAGPVVTGIGYYLAAMIVLSLTREGDGIATLWPASGILLAALLASSGKGVGWYVLAAALASFAANLGLGNAPGTTIGFTVANMVESCFANWLLRTGGKGRVSFTNFSGLIYFCMVAVIATTLSATIAAGMAASPSMRFWFSWFSTDLLGILTVTPPLLIACGTLRRVRLPADLKGAAETVGMFALVALVAGFTFWQSRYPLLFLPMLAVIIAAIRLGPFGATGSVLIVTVIGSVATSIGVGPHILAGAGLRGSSLFLQFYLLTLFAAALPIAALLTTQRELADRLAEKMRLLELAESAAQVGHWRFNTATQALTWSSEVFRIHGIDGTVAPPLDKAVEAYHRDDRANVAAHLERSIEHRDGFAFTARIVRPDGEVRHVLSKGEIDRIGDDGSFELFGIIQDITAQVAYERAIEAARGRAEEAARAATIMAETDQLTGIANRRRTTFLLDKAVLDSRRTGKPISVAIFDIDHFKRINDTYGHQTGDEVLKRVASDAAGKLRRGDTVGRFGGEEFVIVLPDATAQTALLLAERVRDAIEAGGSNPSVTISVGVAELAIDEACEALLHRVDAALYVAKREGRNTIRLAS